MLLYSQYAPCDVEMQTKNIAKTGSHNHLKIKLYYTFILVVQAQSYKGRFI